MPIKILPPEIISKIAAGEVIERPASVIKELLENSLDAGASEIRIDLKDAGKELIRIIDNGKGIPHADMNNIFHRHATSKISEIDDLYSIQSLGFRGEALYSISAIADVVLKSKTMDEGRGTRDEKRLTQDDRASHPDESPIANSSLVPRPSSLVNSSIVNSSIVNEAWEIHIRGGERLDLKPCALTGHGTDITIRELFFNTPARRKFIKSNTAELNAILNIIIPYTILHHNHSFKVTHEGRTLIDIESAKTICERMSNVLGLDSKEFIESAYDFTDKNFKCRAVLSGPNLTRTRRDMQFIFINDRPVQNKAIAFHINEIYRLVLPPSVSPIFALFINIDAGEVDANVHPTKREVKIRNEQEISSILRHYCENLLMTRGKPKIIKTHEAGLMTQDTGRTHDSGLMTQGGIIGGINDNVFSEPFYPSISDNIGEYKSSTRATNEYTVPRTTPQEQAEFFASLAIPQDSSMHAKLTASVYIGQFRNKYLLFESGASLLLFDQHAAQERIVFEQLITHMQKGGAEIQHQLAPVILKLTTQELLVWEELQNDLDKLGFASAQFDQESIAIHSAPALITDIKNSVMNILSGDQIARADHETMARRACRSSVMSGQKLDPAQAINQRNGLLECVNPFTCPHGRPTVVEVTEEFLNKQFLRA